LVKRKIEFQLKISSSIQQQVVLGFMLLDLSGGNPNYLLSAYKRIKNICETTVDVHSNKVIF